MPRSKHLTWQPGVNGRAGRWRKKYRGKVYYFEGGRGKSDREAYDSALRSWELEKLKVDATAPRKHELDYQTEISRWDQVLSWSRRHGDSDMAQLAFDTKKKLLDALEAPVLSPVSREDRFENLFEPVAIEIPESMITGAFQAIARGEVTFRGLPELSLESRKKIVKELDGSELRIQREIWNDRLESQQLRAEICTNTVEAHIQKFLQFKKRQVDQGKLSQGRLYAIRLHLQHFRDWIGQESAVSDISGATLLDYHSTLLKLVERISNKSELRTHRNDVGSWTSTTARHYMITVKAFVRWLWEIEAISTLPRVLGHSSKTLRVYPRSPFMTQVDI